MRDTRLRRALRSPLGEDFPTGIAWFMVVSMLVFFASVFVIFGSFGEAFCYMRQCR